MGTKMLHSSEERGAIKPIKGKKTRRKAFALQLVEEEDQGGLWSSREEKGAQGADVSAKKRQACVRGVEWGATKKRRASSRGKGKRRFGKGLASPLVGRKNFLVDGRGGGRVLKKTRGQHLRGAKPQLVPKKKASMREPLRKKPVTPMSIKGRREGHLRIYL